LPNQFVEWTDEETLQLVQLKRSGLRWSEISERLHIRTVQACKTRYYDIGGHIGVPETIRESPYPRYDNPLKMEGNALVIPDPEVPYHHADFMNRILELAQVWGIKQAIIAGDFIHLATLSSWPVEWVQPNGHGGLTEDQEKGFLQVIQELPEKYRGKIIDKIEDLGILQADNLPNFSEEMKCAREIVKILSQIFDNIDYIVGNHEGRLLRTLDSPLFADEITRMIEAPEPKWRIAPYYFSYLVSNGQEFQIEHPKNYDRSSAIVLADKFERHILMGHSHRLSYNFSVSGKFYAIQMGCCGDESRMPFASQRHNKADTHLLGAVIVRDGYPWLLHERIDWNRMKRL